MVSVQVLEQCQEIFVWRLEDVNLQNKRHDQNKNFWVNAGTPTTGDSAESQTMKAHHRLAHLLHGVGRGSLAEMTAEHGGENVAARRQHRLVSVHLVPCSGKANMFPIIDERFEVLWFKFHFLNHMHRREPPFLKGVRRITELLRVPSTLKTTSALCGWLKKSFFMTVPVWSLRKVPMLGLRNSSSFKRFTQIVSNSTAK